MTSHTATRVTGHKWIGARVAWPYKVAGRDVYFVGTCVSWSTKGAVGKTLFGVEYDDGDVDVYESHHMRLGLRMYHKMHMTVVKKEYQPECVSFPTIGLQPLESSTPTRRASSTATGGHLAHRVRKDVDPNQLVCFPVVISPLMLTGSPGDSAATVLAPWWVTTPEPEVQLQPLPAIACKLSSPNLQRLELRDLNWPPSQLHMSSMRGEGRRGTKRLVQEQACQTALRPVRPRK